MTPLALTDSELDVVLDCARPLAFADRQRFFEAVAAELQGKPLGPGMVFRICREMQRRFLNPPDTRHVPIKQLLKRRRLKLAAD